MVSLRSQVKRVLEKIIGRDIQMFGSKSFSITHNDNWMDTWFAYRSQLRSIINKYNIDLVLDIGANEGQFAKLTRTLYSGEIISFEPIASVFEKLSEESSSDPLWKVRNIALGSEEKSQTIYISDKTVFSSLLKTNDYCVQRFGEVSKGNREEEIKIKRLDSILKELIPNIKNRRIFLKMDTQGYDIEVFKGAETILDNVYALQSEVSLIPIYEEMPHWTDTIVSYEKKGFGIFGLFPVSRDSGRVIEYDCLMVRLDN